MSTTHNFIIISKAIMYTFVIKAQTNGALLDFIQPSEFED